MQEKTKMQHTEMHGQQGLEKVSEQIKNKQHPCVKWYQMENIVTILLQNTLISEMCFLLPN